MRITLYLSLLIALVSIPHAFAQVMQSNSYQIQSDSINLGGGYSSSTSYRLEDTLGEIATGPSESASYRLRAGYQQMHEVYLALTGADDVAMSPALGGVTGGTANGSTTVTVTTDSASGYELSIVASSSPAMQGNVFSDTIANYTPTGVEPDFTFSVAAGAAEFGFTPEGVDIAQRYQDDAGSCNQVGSDTTDACWDPLTTTPVIIATRASSNHPSGTDTVLKFRTVIGANANQLADTYTATTTITAVAL